METKMIERDIQKYIPEGGDLIELVRYWACKPGQMTRTVEQTYTVYFTIDDGTIVLFKNNTWREWKSFRANLIASLGRNGVELTRRGETFTLVKPCK